MNDKKIIMEEQESESADVKWFFPVINEVTMEELEEALSLTMHFYKNHSDLMKVISKESHIAVSSAGELLILNWKFQLSHLNILTEIYLNEVKNKGEFKYLVLGGKYVMRTADIEGLLQNCNLPKLLAELGRARMEVQYEINI